MSESAFQKTLREARWTAPLCLLCAAVALGLYFRAGLFEFCTLDDAAYVMANKMVRAGLSWHSVRQAFISDNVMYWHPLTSLSFLVDSHFYGSWPGGYHVTNALWHSANVALFFLLILRLSGSRVAATLAALLLAVHPAHVEAVAWISARKDMLSTFFGLATMHLYISWTRRPGAGLALALYLAYALSLMGKPMFVTMPALLLLLDYWPLGRLGAVDALGRARLLPDWRFVITRVREKVLLLAMGLFVAFMALTSHYEGYDRLDPNLALKIANALSAYAKYLGLLVWPTNQAIVYPFPDAVPLAHSLGGAALLLAVTGLCLWQARVRPSLLVGWLWFLGTLVPVIMPPRVGLHVELADRWTYVPFLGLYLALGCLAAEWAGRLERPVQRALAAIALLALVLVPLGLRQQRQLSVWTNSTEIYEQALRVTEKNHLVLNNYAGLKVGEGDTLTAERCYLEALAIWPDFPNALHNLGLLRQRQQRCPEALELFQANLRLMEKKGHAYDVYRSTAQCLSALGRMPEAAEYLAKAIDENPKRPEAYMDWAGMARVLGDLQLAGDLYRKALEADPENKAARLGLAGLRLGARQP